MVKLKEKIEQDCVNYLILINEISPLDKKEDIVKLIENYLHINIGNYKLMCHLLWKTK